MRFFGWLGKVMIGAIVATCISAVTTFYLVNTYVQELVKPFSAFLPENKIELSEFLGNLWSQANILGQGDTPAKKDGEKPEPAPSQAETVPEEAVAVWSQSRAGEMKERVVISDDQFQSKREQLSEDDKATVFAMLVSELPQEELLNISAKLEDGITSSELAEIETIVEKYLSPEQYEKLIGIVNKY